MDSERFDRLAKTFSTPDTRRGLLRLVAGVPLAGALAALLGDRPEAAAQQDPERGGSHRRRKRKRRHDPGEDKDNRKGQRKGKKRRCAQAGQALEKRKRKTCCAGLRPDASGRCAASSLSPPASPGCSGLTPTQTSPTQGLQEAIDAADPGATLTLCAGTWKLTETVVIGKELTIIGAGARQTILDGGRPPRGLGGVRVLSIEPGATVTLQDLMITKGQAVDGFYPDNAGGGIYNDQSTLTLLGVSVTGNTADSGGGIFNDWGTVTLQADSHVTDNTATFSGGGFYNHRGTLTLEGDSSVTDNSADSDGGGIFNHTGSVTLQADSRVSDNTATFGGAIINIGSGTVMLQAGSRVSENTATSGGGIYNVGGPVTVDARALVCNNSPDDDQCGGPIQISNCPNPPGGSCPVD